MPASAADDPRRSSEPRPAPGQPRRVDESMTLLNEVMQRPLDPGYAAEAARREAAGLSRTPPAQRWRMAVILLLIGLIVGICAVALRQPKDAVAAQKNALIAQIERKQREADATEAQIATWEREMSALRAQVLSRSSQDQLLARLTGAEVAAAATTLRGPGLVVTVDDARTAGGTSADGNPRTGSDDPGRVQSSDLQLVVNGLWEAGAEGIDVNGHRLAATSAIRFAGEAILVDYRPLARPYVIHALGDPAQLKARFAATSGGQALTQLGHDVGIQSSLAQESSMTLAADSSLALRYARNPASVPSDTPTPTPSRTPTPTSTTEAHP